jgi:DNA-directed RNA polymerase beta subunit
VVNVTDIRCASINNIKKEMNVENEPSFCEEFTSHIAKLLPLANLFNYNESSCDSAESVLTRELHQVVKNYPPKRHYTSYGSLRMFVIRKAVISRPAITEVTGDVRALTPTECKQRMCSLLGSMFIWYDEWEWSPKHPFSFIADSALFKTNTRSAKQSRLVIDVINKMKSDRTTEEATAATTNSHVSAIAMSDAIEKDWTLTRPYKCKLYEGHTLCEMSTNDQEAFPFLIRFEHHPRHKLTDLPIPVHSIACHSYHSKLSSAHNFSSAYDGTFLIRGTSYISLKTSSIKRNYAFLNMKERTATMRFRKGKHTQTRMVVLQLVSPTKQSHFDALVWKIPYIDATEQVPWYLVLVALICSEDNNTERAPEEIISIVCTLMENYLSNHASVPPSLMVQLRKFLQEQIQHARLACATLTRSNALLYIGQRTRIEKDRLRASIVSARSGHAIASNRANTSPVAEQAVISHNAKLQASRDEELMRLGQSSMLELFSHLGRSDAAEASKLAHLCDMTARLLLCVHGHIREDVPAFVRHQRFRANYDFLPFLLQHHMKEHIQGAFYDTAHPVTTASSNLHKKLAHTGMSKRIEGAFLFTPSDKAVFVRDRTPRLAPLDPVNASAVLSLQRMTVAADTNKHSTDLRSRELHDDIGVCPVETPIGDACGVNRPMSIFARMSVQGMQTWAFTERIIQTYGLCKTEHIFGQSDISEICNSLRKHPIRMYINGRWVASCTLSKATHVACELRCVRYSLFARTFVSVHEATETRQLNLWVDSGRISMPLLNVAKLNQLLSQPVSATDGRKLWMVLSWDMLLAGNYIDMIDAEELPNVTVAADPWDFLNRRASDRNPHGVPFTHMEILTIAKLGAAAAQGVLMPFSKASRHIIECAQRGLGPRLLNHITEFNKLVRVMEYPSKPLVCSMAIDLLNTGTTPTGRSVCIALTDFGQQSYADAISIDQAIIDRGFSRQTQYHTLTVCEKKNGARTVHTIQRRDGLSGNHMIGRHVTYGSNPSECTLDIDGFAHIGARVEHREGSVLVGCVEHVSAGVKKCNDTLATRTASGIVHRCLITTTKEGLRMGKVTVRKLCKPSSGDKFNVRPGIKGVMARSYQRQDMVFTTDGEIIEMLINYTTLINRGTLGPVLEMLLGTSAIHQLSCGNGTSFFKDAFQKYTASAETHAVAIAASGLANGNTNFENISTNDAFLVVQRALKRQGLSDNGTQTLISGRTGRQLNGKGRVFCFGTGTQVLMGNGCQRDIETIQPGEAVMGGHGQPVRVVDVVSGSDTLYKIEIKQAPTCCLVPSSHMDSYSVTAHHILVLKCDTAPKLYALSDSIYCIHTYALQVFPTPDVFAPRAALFTEKVTYFDWRDYDTENALLDDINDTILAEPRSILWEVTVRNFLSWQKRATTTDNIRSRVHGCWSSNVLMPLGATSGALRFMDVFDGAEMTQFVHYICMKHNIDSLPPGIISMEHTIAWFLGAWLNGGCYVNEQVAIRIPFHHAYKSNARLILCGVARIFGLRSEDWYIGTGLMCQGTIFSTTTSAGDNVLLQLLTTWGFVQSGHHSCNIDRFYTTCLQQTEAFRKALVQGFCDVSVQKRCDAQCAAVPHAVLAACSELHSGSSATHTYKNVANIRMLPPYQHRVAIDCGVYICLTMRSLGYKAILQGEETNESLPIVICHVDAHDYAHDDTLMRAVETPKKYQPMTKKTPLQTTENRSLSSLHQSLLQHDSMAFSNLDMTPLLSRDALRLESIMHASDETRQPVCDEVTRPTRCHGYPFDITQLDELRPFHGLVLEQYNSEEHKHRFLLAHLILTHNCGHIHCDALIQRAEDGMHNRTTGPRHWITKQPLNGASQHGGLQFGEQEASVLMAHGAAFSLHQFRTQSSDYHREHICSQCKQYGEMNIKNDSGMCRRCGDGEHIVQWPTNRAFIKHDRDVRSLGLWPSFEMQTIRQAPESKKHTTI